MKKDNNILYFGLLLAATVLAEIFCIVEGINIIGVSIAVWIATYLFVDVYRTNKAKRHEQLEKNFHVHMDSLKKIEEGLYTRMDNLEKVEKALYVRIKKNEELMKEQMQRMSEERKTGFKEMMESQSKSTKIIVKYIQDDIKKASMIEKANSERIAATIQQGVQKMIAQRETGTSGSDRMMENLNANFYNLIHHMERCVSGIQSVYPSQKSGEVKEGFFGSEDTIEQKSTTGQESVPERVGVFEQERNPEQESMVEQEDALLDTVPEAAVAEEALDPNRRMNADEIASLLSSIESDKEEKDKDEAVDLSDPNKQLSADEIAALFTSMG